MRLSLDEQKKLRAKARKELKRVEDLLSNPDVRQEIANFKDAFIKCEDAYKVILSEHQFRKNKKRPEYMKIDMTQAPYALKFAGYNIDYTVLTKLFGSETRIGKRSVKKLRDALSHKPEEKDIAELRDRKNELYGCIDEFLRIIHSYK